MSSDNWWQYQAKRFAPKKNAAPKIPPFKPRHDPDIPQRVEPQSEPMVVEESDPSDTAIHRIFKFLTK